MILSSTILLLDNSVKSFMLSVKERKSLGSMKPLFLSFVMRPGHPRRFASVLWAARTKCYSGWLIDNMGLLLTIAEAGRPGRGAGMAR